MKCVSWIHTADLHLGQPIKGLRMDAFQKRSQEYFETFNRITEVAKERKVNFLFISGDFVEHGYIDNFLYNKIYQTLREINPIKVFISPGNHDPYREDSIYRNNIWPDNVHIFPNTWQIYNFPEYDLSIVGRGFADFSERLWIPPNCNSLHNNKIMIIHGTFSPLAKDNTRNYLPFDESDVSKLDFDYIACGHIHKPQGYTLNNKKKTIFHYPGSPEALNWKETGPRSVIHGILKNHKVHTTRIDVHSKRYEIIEIDITGISSADAIHKLVLTKIVEFPKTYIKIIFVGRVESKLNLSLLLRDMDHPDLYLEDKSEKNFDLEYLRKQKGIIGAFIRKIEAEMLQNPSYEQELTNILYTGLEVMIE